MKAATRELFTRIFKVLKPPPNMTLSEWADEYQKLPAKSSAEPGQWRTSRVPYMREIMDARAVYRCGISRGGRERNVRGVY